MLCDVTWYQSAPGLPRLSYLTNSKTTVVRDFTPTWQNYATVTRLQLSGPPRPMESRWAVLFWFHDPAVVLADHRQPWIQSCKYPSAMGYGCKTSGTIMDLQTEPWWHVGLSANCVTMRNLFSNGLPSFSLVNLPRFGGYTPFSGNPQNNIALLATDI
jgi:hypothetical protein